MSNRHKIRELALQALYQIETRGEEDSEAVQASVNAGPADSQAKKAAWELATTAWVQRHKADDLSGEIAPAWPPHRQPLVDRSIIRLAYYELAVLGTPAAVIINESIELAKTFGSERSPSFINGVLDKMARRIERTESDDATETQPGTEAGAPLSIEAGAPIDPEKAADPWLADALGNSRTGEADQQESATPVSPAEPSQIIEPAASPNEPAPDSPAKPITE